MNDFFAGQVEFGAGTAVWRKVVDELGVQVVHRQLLYRVKQHAKTVLHEKVSVIVAD